MAKVVRAAQNLKMEERIDRVEMPLARLLALLTQYPDLDWENEGELKDMARFIEFFVECIARKDNIALLFTIANKLKTVTMAGEEMDEEKIKLFLEPRRGARDGGGDAAEGNGLDEEVVPSPTIVSMLRGGGAAVTFGRPLAVAAGPRQRLLLPPPPPPRRSARRYLPGLTGRTCTACLSCRRLSSGTGRTTISGRCRRSRPRLSFRAICLRTCRRHRSRSRSRDGRI